jgi:hypothetical protein
MTKIDWIAEYFVGGDAVSSLRSCALWRGVLS